MNQLQQGIVKAVSTLFFQEQDLHYWKYPRKAIILYDYDNDETADQYFISYTEIDGQDYLEIRYESDPYEEYSHNKTIVLIPFDPAKRAWNVDKISQLIEIILLNEDPDMIKKYI